MKLPDRFLDRMKFLLKDEFEAFLGSYKEDRYQGIRVNTLKIDYEEFLKICPFEIKGEVPWAKNGLYISEEKPGRHPYHAAGLYYIQEPSAMSVTPQLNIKPGERVLDLCASPGGKSTQAACYLNGEGLLVSNEIKLKRAQILVQNIERMGIKNAIVTNNSPEELEKVFVGYFDKVIVDAPCSGEGMFKKDKDALNQWSEENVLGYQSMQREILKSAAKMVKPGGLIIYSTCTFSVEENEFIVDEFLKKHEEFELINIEKNYGFREGFFEILDNEELKKTARLFPHRLKGEGHFLALFYKKDGEVKSPQRIKSNIKKQNISDFKEFEKNYLNKKFDEDRFFLRGDRLYYLPENSFDFTPLNVLRPGILLGEFKKNRFEPDYSLAASLKPHEAKLNISLSSKTNEADKYIEGYTLNFDLEDGWYLVDVDGYSLSWGKMSKGILKNYFPKALRW
ncbi:RsmB/NOP family class I SAM-dependent RNA methyltransferase [Caloramator sp. CAR-1]|uniref:RsmF rRNA methyltransferase first C-terminal domain-containing protein n=1 Tax=Caloramator sp. CAR-1 TaxID=3062777 RepID=UPI0026E21938|nr:RsmB/NOP family class I SAM-dependent RNA methyltransferase [Caloramator sp. CAR-1]MDO6355215.1 RsmB/NOP family class I SAM-dependent RNA methyltransferase [Caloramator sp. CAR-1]